MNGYYLIAMNGKSRNTIDLDKVSQFIETETGYVEVWVGNDPVAIFTAKEWAGRRVISEADLFVKLFPTPDYAWANGE